MHIRLNEGLLAAAERRALAALAARLPGRVMPDHLTALALAAMAGAALSLAFAATSAGAALAFAACLALNWFGDSLDGTLARYRHIERPRYGYYVDHVVDLAGATLLLGGFAASGLMSPAAALALLAGYLLASAETYLATHATGTFRLSFAGIGPTELRVLLAVGVLAGRTHVWTALWGVPVRVFDIAGVVGAAALAAAFVANALQNGRVLFRREPLPTHPPGAVEKASNLLVRPGG